MQAHISNRVRLFLWALPLAGLLFTIGIILRGPSLDPSLEPDRFAQAAVAAGAATAWLIIFIGMVLELLGFGALYTYLADDTSERPAFWGMIFSLIGVALILPLMGFMGLAAPVVGRLYLQGQPEVMSVAVVMAADGPALVVAGVSGLTYIAGSILFAVALWRQGNVPKWLIIAYALQAPLLSFAALFSFAAELLGAVLLVASSGWIVWRARQAMPAEEGTGKTITAH